MSKDVGILELAELIREVGEIEGGIERDTSKTAGTAMKLLDVSTLIGFVWEAHVQLQEGMGETYDWFLEEESTVGKSCG